MCQNLLDLNISGTFAEWSTIIIIFADCNGNLFVNYFKSKYI